MARDRRVERQRLDLIAGLDIGAHHRAPTSAQRHQACNRRAASAGRRAAIAAAAGAPRRPARRSHGRCVAHLALRHSTEQVPQLPRPPQAPTMRKPLRRAQWKMVSPGCVVDAAVELRKRKRTRRLGSDSRRCCDSAPRAGANARVGRRLRRAIGHPACGARRTIVAARPARRRQIDADAEHHGDGFERRSAWPRFTLTPIEAASARRSTRPCVCKARPGSPGRNSPAMLKFCARATAHMRSCAWRVAASSNWLPMSSSASASE